MKERTVTVPILNSLRSRPTDNFIDVNGYKVEPSVWQKFLANTLGGTDRDAVDLVQAELEDLQLAISALVSGKAPKPAKSVPTAQPKDPFQEFIDTCDTNVIYPEGTVHAAFVKKYRPYAFVQVSAVYGNLVTGHRLTREKQPYTKTLTHGLNLTPGRYVLVDDGKIVSRAYRLKDELASIQSQAMAALFSK